MNASCSGPRTRRDEVQLRWPVAVHPHIGEVPHLSLQAEAEVAVEQTCDLILAKDTYGAIAEPRLAFGDNVSTGFFRLILCPVNRLGPEKNGNECAVVFEAGSQPRVKIGSLSVEKQGFHFNGACALLPFSAPIGAPVAVR